jgi:hypothetical protein
MVGVIISIRMTVAARTVRRRVEDTPIGFQYTSSGYSSGLLFTSRAPYEVLGQTTAFTKGKTASRTFSNTIL